MGTLYYGSSNVPIEINDRSLAHLKVVITTKLRRNESFLLSWKHSAEEPGGRSALWLHPSIPLRFTFDAAEAVALNPDWLAQLAESASTAGNVQLVPEAATGPLTVQAD